MNKNSMRHINTSSSRNIAASFEVIHGAPNSPPSQLLIGLGASGWPGIGRCRKTLRLLQLGPPITERIFPSTAALNSAA